jgi:hypothetical protein
LKALKELRCFFFCFRVLYYKINRHALKNAFQLQIDWLGFCSQLNLIIQAMPKIPKLIYLNLFFFLKLSKYLNPRLKCSISVA